VLYASNGDGKSCFSDALEWFYTDSIEHLRREGCTRTDYFNYASPQQDASVSVELVGGPSGGIIKTLLRKGSSSLSVSSQTFEEYLRASKEEQFILRFDTMRQFLDKTKTEKLEEVEEIIGFGVVRRARDAILQAFNALGSDLALRQLRW
jgi:hypothetical protein